MTIKIVTEKFCPDCKTTKSEEYFGKANRRDGLRSYCKACEQDRHKAKVASLKEQIYDKHGHGCCRCGYADKRALQIDHIFGGGTKERAVVKSTVTYLKKVLADKTGLYQILCANCNWIKRAEKGEESFGSTLSEEGRQRISKASRERVVSEETRKKQSAAKIGKPLSEKHRQKLVVSIAESWTSPEIRASRIEGAKGKTWTEEQKINQSEVARKREAAKKESGYVYPKLTEEQKDKLRGREFTPEHCEKISIAAKVRAAEGKIPHRVWTEEQKAAVTGRKRTPEQIENLRQGALKREAVKREKRLSAGVDNPTP